MKNKFNIGDKVSGVSGQGTYHEGFIIGLVIEQCGDYFYWAKNKSIGLCFSEMDLNLYGEALSHEAEFDQLKRQVFLLNEALKMSIAEVEDTKRMLKSVSEAWIKEGKDD